MEWITKLISVLKIPLKILLPAIWIFSGILLLSPKSFISKLQLSGFSKKYGYIFGIVFIITTSLILMYILHFVFEKIRNFYKEVTKNRKVIKSVDKMNDAESSCILAVYHSDNFTTMLDYSQPIVKSLLERNFLYAGNNAPVQLDYNNRMLINVTLQPLVIQALDWKYRRTIKKINYLEEKIDNNKDSNKLDYLNEQLEYLYKIEKELRRGY